MFKWLFSKKASRRKNNDAPPKTICHNDDIPQETMCDNQHSEPMNLKCLRDYRLFIKRA